MKFNMKAKTVFICVCIMAHFCCSAFGQEVADLCFMSRLRTVMPFDEVRSVSEIEPFITDFCRTNGTFITTGVFFTSNPGEGMVQGWLSTSFAPVSGRGFRRDVPTLAYESDIDGSVDIRNIPKGIKAIDLSGSFNLEGLPINEEVEYCSFAMSDRAIEVCQKQLLTISEKFPSLKYLYFEVSVDAGCKLSVARLLDMSCLETLIVYCLGGEIVGCERLEHWDQCRHPSYIKLADVKSGYRMIILERAFDMLFRFAETVLHVLGKSDKVRWCRSLEHSMTLFLLEIF